MHPIDYLIIGFYLILLVILSVYRNPKSKSETNYLLSGRKVTMPAFVATLVSTWYGGILGIGEFTWLYGISQWFVMGLPYYVFAILFACFLAKKIRENPSLSIPESVGAIYGKASSDISSVWVFLLVSPAPYILMTAMLMQYVFGTEMMLYLAVIVACVSALYVGYGGFRAVVRTDILQVVLMYSGFAILLAYVWAEWGTPANMWINLPEAHREPDGGQPFTWLIVWFFIALWTFVDPSFHQRAAAAKDGKTARNGIFVSVLLWFVFDMMSLTVALYGVAYLSDIPNAALVYPDLAFNLLPAGLKGLFFLTLIATIMSTLDSYLFLSGQTIGRDLLRDRFRNTDPIKLTRIGIFLSTLIGVLLVWAVPSVIDLWFVIGSILIPGLLLPVIGIYYPAFRVRRFATWALFVPVLVSAFWMGAGYLSTGIIGSGYLGVEAFYPGIAVSALMVYVLR